jgi:hypothetical protein
VEILQSYTKQFNNMQLSIIVVVSSSKE